VSTAIEAPRPQVASALTPVELVQPLTRLQQAIRRYVLLEGLAWLVIFVCLWAAVAFLFDWGLLFALFGLDYLRDGGPAVVWFLRVLFVGSLGFGVAWVVGYHFLYRLSATFSQDELALVLERRFPQLLGDRLLTAVQLADPAQARKYDYSWDMVQSTVKEAMDRVTQLRVGQVFDWSRLLRRLGLALLLAVGATATAFLATDHAALWAERTLEFEDIYWPRAYILEVPDFATSPTRAVPYGEEQRVTVQVWKWVAATRDNREGWRRLEWADVLPGQRPQRPWELDPPPGDPALFALLPADWQKLPLDELEVRLAAANPTTRRELGLAVIRRLHAETGSVAPGTQPKLWPAFQPYMPETWRQEKDHATLRQLLTLALQVPPEELQRLTEKLQTLRPLPSDVQRALPFALLPLQPPLPSASLLARVFAPDKTPLPPDALSAAEMELLPATWRQLPQTVLVRRLKEFRQQESAEAVGSLVEQKTLALFQELEARILQSHIGRRRGLRRLFENVNDVPVFLAFEPVQDGVEQLRTAGKSGRQQVRRVPGTNDFVYIFKKIESPFRFRADAERVVTPWYRVNVRPVPQLKYFHQTNDEPGYIHNSNFRVTTGPHVISMIGTEWRTEAAAGSRLVWSADCFKPLRTVELTIEGGAEQPVVEHSPGTSAFTARLRRLGPQTQMMRLKLTDLDGITVIRPIRLVPVPDKEPTFGNLAFALVNPKMITAEAQLPLTGQIADDHGLTGMSYDVLVQTMDRKTNLFAGRFPVRRFRPIRPAGLTPVDFRFDTEEALTLARMQTGIQGDPFYFLPVMAHQPLLGPWTLMQLPRCDLPRSQTFDYQDEYTFGPALLPHHEHLDLLQVVAEANRRMNRSADRPLAPTPYRVLIKLVAQDSRMNEESQPPVPAPQEGKSEQMFEFLVVDERTLQVEVGNREEELHANSQDVVRVLQKARDDLSKMSKELGNYQPDEFRKVAEDLRQVAQLVAEQRQLTRTKILLPFRAAYRELAVNRCQPLVLDRIDHRICRPLTELTYTKDLYDQLVKTETGPRKPQLTPGFELAHLRLLELAARLDAEGAKTPAGDFAPPIRDLEETIRRMQDVMKEMQKLIEFHQALKALEELIRAQEEQNKKMKEQQEKEKKKELDP
jgi:hypothetical protein